MLPLVEGAPPSVPPVKLVTVSVAACEVPLTGLNWKSRKPVVAATELVLTKTLKAIGAALADVTVHASAANPATSKLLDLNILGVLRLDEVHYHTTPE